MKKLEKDDIGLKALPTRSRAVMRRIGFKIRRFLKNADGSDPLHALLIRILACPYTATTVGEIAKLGVTDFLTSDVLRLSNGALLFNIFKGLPATCLSELNRFLSGERSLTGDIEDDREWLKAIRVLESWEASVGHAHAPVLTLIAGCRSEVAMPDEIRLGGYHYKNPHKAFKPLVAPSHWSSAVRKVADKIAAARLHQNMPEYERLLGVMDEIAVKTKRPFVRIAARFVLHVCGLPMARITSDSADRYAEAGIHILELIAKKQKLILSKVESHAFRELTRSVESLPYDSFIRKRIESQKPERKPRSPKPFCLQPPQVLEKLLGYDDPKNWSNDLQGRTRRVIAAICMETGRRANCMILLTRGCFHVSPISGEISLFIPKSKTEAGSNNYLNLSKIWPDDEIEILKAWLEETKDVAPDTYLLTLAGIRKSRVRGNTEEKKLASINWPLERDRLSRTLYPSPTYSRVRLSNARTNWATWFLVRVLCAFDRSLLNHPLMAEARFHRWFSDSNLDKIRALLKTPVADALEAARRIMGHANWTEFMDSYCVSWPLLIALKSSQQD